MGKKIVVVLETDPEWGGQHQYALMLMECLFEMADIDLDVNAICCSRYWRKWCRENKIHVLDTSWLSLCEREQQYHIKHSLLSRIYCTFMSEIGKTLRKEKVEAVLCTTQGMFIPNLNTKVIVPVHDLMHRYEGQFPEVKSEYKKRELIFGSKAKYAWCVLTDSKLGKEQFRESYSNYMTRGLPHIVSLPFVVSKHIARCEEAFVDVPSKYVFYPAQFWEHKNHIHLLEAVALLKDVIPNIHLVLVGSEKNNGRKIQTYISEHELGKNVTIKGFVSDENITYLYRHAVGMIMPSYFGPTNIPPLEAMALGCPVAVSDKYAMPEQVGDAGLLFNPDSPKEIAECIRKMWCDEKLRQQMIKKGYERVNRWTKKKFCKRLEKIIEKL